MLKIFQKIIDKIPIKEAAFICLVVCGTILFAPDAFIETLGLLSLRNEYRSWIGLFFLLSLAGCIVWFLIFLKNQAIQSDFLYRRVAKKYLKTLISKDEKVFLIKNYYDRNTNEFISMARIDMTNGNVAPLTAANIIYRATSMSQHGLSKWPYNLQPDVRMYLNKAIHCGKIVISEDGYTWRL